MMSCFKQVNQLFDQSENSISCDYYDVDDFNKIGINQSDLTVIYLNISCLALHIDKLKLFLSLIKTTFDKTYAKFIAANESLITNFTLFHKYLFSKNDSFPNISGFLNFCNIFCLSFYRKEETK